MAGCFSTSSGAPYTVLWGRALRPPLLPALARHPRGQVLLQRLDAPVRAAPGPAWRTRCPGLSRPQSSRRPPSTPARPFLFGLPGEDVHHHQAILRLPPGVLAEVDEVGLQPVVRPLVEVALPCELVQHVEVVGQISQLHFENISATYVFERRARHRSRAGVARVAPLQKVLDILTKNVEAALERLKAPPPASMPGRWRARYRPPVGGLARLCRAGGAAGRLRCQAGGAAGGFYAGQVRRNFRQLSA